MTYSLNYPNPQNPNNYSGVTINVTNPAVNTAPQLLQTPQMAQHICDQYCNHNALNATQRHHFTQPVVQLNQQENITPAPNYSQVYPQMQVQPQGIPNAYPPQYYLNNYNYATPSIQRENPNAIRQVPQEQVDFQQNEIENINNNEQYPIANENLQKEQDLTTSQNIINQIDEGIAKQKEEEQIKANSKTVELTNEYIMSLENHLNNPDYEIRANATKEILTRLDEDRSRYDDAALNALLNKMLQDPNSTIRSAAMSAFSSGLASGNDYTVKLITDIQNNPKSNKADVIEASNILLRMSREAQPNENLDMGNQNQEMSEIK